MTELAVPTKILSSLLGQSSLQPTWSLESRESWKQLWPEACPVLKALKSVLSDTSCGLCSEELQVFSGIDDSPVAARKALIKMVSHV